MTNFKEYKMFVVSVGTLLMIALLFVYFCLTEISESAYKKLTNEVCEYGPSWVTCSPRSDYHNQLVKEALLSGDKITGFEYIIIQNKSSDYDSENDLLNTKNAIKDSFND